MAYSNVVKYKSQEVLSLSDFFFFFNLTHVSWEGRKIQTKKEGGLKTDPQMADNLGA